MGWGKKMAGFLSLTSYRFKSHAICLALGKSLVSHLEITCLPCFSDLIALSSQVSDEPLG